MTASEKILQKVLVSSNIDSRRWNGIQAGLRDRAFFSSRVAEANILDAARGISAEYAGGRSDLSRLRMRLRDYIEGTGYTPNDEDRGTVKDLTSYARLNAIIKTNVAQARGFIQYADGMTPGAFGAFPAQEFIRVSRRNRQRTDWPERWRKAGGKTYEGRMIALKDDPVWTRLSVFGLPHPPFDWGSGMGVLDVGRKEAVRLGIVTDEEVRQKVAKLREQEEKGDHPSMNGKLQANVPATREVVSRMKADFGDLADVVRVGDELTLKWRPEVLRETVLQKKDFRVECGVPQEGLLNKLMTAGKMEHFANQIRDKQLVVDQGWRDQKRRLGGTHLRHFSANSKFPDEIPLCPDDVELIPSIWRDPSRVVKIDNEKFSAELDAIDGSTYVLQVKIDERERMTKRVVGGRTINVKELYKQPIIWTFFRTTMPSSKKIELHDSLRPALVTTLKGRPATGNP